MGDSRKTRKRLCEVLTSISPICTPAALRWPVTHVTRISARRFGVCMQSLRPKVAEDRHRDSQPVERPLHVENGSELQKKKEKLEVGTVFDLRSEGKLLPRFSFLFGRFGR